MRTVPVGAGPVGAVPQRRDLAGGRRGATNRIERLLHCGGWNAGEQRRDDVELTRIVCLASVARRSAHQQLLDLVRGEARVPCQEQGNRASDHRRGHRRAAQTDVASHRP